MEKKQIRILIALAVFVIASLIFFFTYEGKNNVEVPPVTITPLATTTVSTFKVKTESLTDSVSTYDVLVEYPQFENAATGTVEARINTQFKKEAQGVFEETSTELKQAAVGMEGRDIVFERKLQADKTYINNETGIMSFVYSQYIDTGGAHVTFMYGAQSVDIKNGEKVTLDDLLTGTYDASLIKEIDRQIRTGATTCVRCDFLAGELENLKVEIPDNYLLSDQGITFLFGAYELGSNAATSNGQEVFIHKDFLNQYILRTW